MGWAVIDGEPAGHGAVAPWVSWTEFEECMDMMPRAGIIRSVQAGRPGLSRAPGVSTAGICMSGDMFNVLSAESGGGYAGPEETAHAR